MKLAKPRNGGLAQPAINGVKRGIWRRLAKWRHQRKQHGESWRGVISKIISSAYQQWRMLWRKRRQTKRYRKRGGGGGAGNGGAIGKCISVIWLIASVSAIENGTASISKAY
jgi:hypothetical protein